MSVKISVGADVNPAVAALNKIKSAAKEAASGNKELADAIAQVNSQFEEAKKVSPGFREALKNTGQQNRKIHEIEWNKLSTNEKLAAKQRSKIVNYATAGTRFGSNEEPSGSRFPSLPIKSAAGLAGLVGASGALGIALHGASSAKTQANFLDELARSTDGLSLGFDRLEKGVGSIGAGLGVSSVEAAKLAKQFSVLSGQTNSLRVMDSTKNAIGFSKGAGINIDRGLGSFARMDWLTGGKANQKEFAVMIADAITTGNMFAKGDEVMASIARFVESSERTMVTAPDYAQFAALKAVMDNNKDTPGLRGQEAENAINALDKGIRNPGGGLAGSTFLYGALGSAKAGRKALNIPEFELLKESGLFGSRKKAIGGIDTTTNLEYLMRGIESTGASENMRALMLRELSGLSMTKSKEMMDVVKEFMDGQISILSEAAKSAGVDLNTVAPSVLIEMGKASRRTDLTQDEKNAELQRLSKQTLTPTKGLKSLEAISKFETGQTALGSKLLPVLSGLTDMGGDILKGFNFMIDKGMDVNIKSMTENVRDEFLGLNKSMRLDPVTPDYMKTHVTRDYTAEKKQTIVLEGEYLIKSESGKILSRVKPHVKPGPAEIQ